MNVQSHTHSSATPVRVSPYKFRTDFIRSCQFIQTTQPNSLGTNSITKMKNGSLKRRNGGSTQPARICLYPKSLPSVTNKSEIHSEYGQLQEMVPTVAKQYPVTKKQVVTEATRYIDELHSELANKLQQEGEMNDFEVQLNKVNQMVLNLMRDTLISPQVRQRSSLQKKQKKSKKQPQ